MHTTFSARLFGALLLLALLPDLALAAYVDNGDGTVTDTITCLQWQKVTMDTTGDGVPDTLTWQQALAAAENLTLADRSDWRLPDNNELRSLVDFSRYDPAIDPVFAVTTQSYFYWTSNSRAFYWTDNAWLVEFFNGQDVVEKKTYNYYARAVRGGQCGTLFVKSQGASAVAVGAIPATFAGITDYLKTGVAAGTTITLTAPETASGMNYRGWSGCNTVNSAARSCNVTISADRTVIVHYGVAFPAIPLLLLEE